ncbi:hypothetical protein Mgra_00005434 [Meloidogyne graminicola]|uniref:Uncharacterized protein n=1 Tax=Meloidogyne graminicola TaxID=189291 RepID=A0A8S9ZPF9_9BILA|nr:hypothetical protein Mgra_00005434 [Meloidogyne graminicola]
MIGMMNNHTVDNPVEFYAGRRSPLSSSVGTDNACSSISEEEQKFLHYLEIRLEPIPKKKLSYTEDGRRCYDGKPEESNESPEEMWAKLMLKLSCNKAIEEGLIRIGRKKRSNSRKILQRIISTSRGSIRTIFGSKKDEERNENNNNINNEEEEEDKIK